MQTCRRSVAVGFVAIFSSGVSGALVVRRGGVDKVQGLDCGALKSFPNAKPKNFKDSQETFFNTDTNKREKVVFKSGDVIDFTCVKGFTLDGSNDGSVDFEVECAAMGYYKPSGVCMEASKCGAVPEIAHAAPTGQKKGTKVEFKCGAGYSLDGEKVVAGGMGDNSLFYLDCVEFSGTYEAFTGECKPYAFVPATETVRLYNKVFEALFTVSCKGTLKKEFGKGNSPGVEDICGNINDGTIAGQCETLVGKIEADFTSEQAARQAHDDASTKDWHEEKDPERPGIEDEAADFCTKLWKLLEFKPTE